MREKRLKRKGIEENKAIDIKLIDFIQKTLPAGFYQRSNLT